MIRRPLGLDARIAWIVCLPSLLLTTYVGVVSIGWRAVDVNLAEAVVYGDAGEAQRLLWNGANPRATYRVSSFVAGRRDALSLTPMEAAIMEERTGLAKLLLANHAVSGSEQAEYLRCLATREYATEIASLIREAFPFREGPCPSIQTPW